MPEQRSRSQSDLGGQIAEDARTMLKELIMPAKSMISVRIKRLIPSTPFEMTRGSPCSAETNRTEGGG